MLLSEAQVKVGESEKSYIHITHHVEKIPRKMLLALKLAVLTAVLSREVRPAGAAIPAAGDYDRARAAHILVRSEHEVRDSL